MQNLLDLPQHEKFPEIVRGIVGMPTGTCEGRATATRGWVSLPETCEAMYRARQRYQDAKK